MLRWQSDPNKTFHRFVSRALRRALREARHPGWMHPESRLGRFFKEEQTAVVIKELLEAHERPKSEVYQLTDWHWLVVYECLEAYRSVTDSVSQSQFNGWLDDYFWDLDFLMPEAVEMGPDLRGQFGVSDEAFSIAAGLRPHPDELRITKCTLCPVCNTAMLVQPGEPVPEHWIMDHDRESRLCAGVGQAAKGGGSK